MAISKSQAKATAKYEKNNYFKTLVRFKKEDEERIRAAAGDSLNGFIVQCVLNTLDKPEAPVQAPEPIKSKYLPPTPENLKKIDFKLLKGNPLYQLEVMEQFGEDTVNQLYGMSEAEFKKLISPDS
jgi:hypothetical protein|nr:MAG TPA: hypothetical protein [Caudoviricetes sp.]DAO07839.1 MAG TPA: hypothetical protein [Caudoviricetes sp.]